MIENLRELGNVTIVKVSGRLDAASAPDMKTELSKIIANGHSELVLDLEELQFIDSSGLGLLVGCLRRCVALGGDLCLLHVPELIRSVLELTRLTRVFQEAESESEAVRLLEQGSAQ